jgi:hypothetical protein
MKNYAKGKHIRQNTPQKEFKAREANTVYFLDFFLRTVSSPLALKPTSSFTLIHLAVP